jgi:hypothetical protein
LPIDDVVKGLQISREPPRTIYKDYFCRPLCRGAGSGQILWDAADCNERFSHDLIVVVWLQAPVRSDGAPREETGQAREASRMPRRQDHSIGHGSELCTRHMDEDSVPNDAVVPICREI